MAARPDYYKALGVEKKASADEIKKSYRKLARQYHPDRNPGNADAEARFKEISQAYDVLERPREAQAVRQRQRTLRPGRRARRRLRGVRQLRLRRLLDGGHPLEPVRGRRWCVAAGAPSRAPSAERDLEAQVSITFDQAVSGAQVPLQVPMHTTCNTCRGTGAKPGTTPTVCPRCEGRGIETEGQGMFSISQPCSLLRRVGHRDRGPLPDVRRQRARCGPSSACG